MRTPHRANVNRQQTSSGRSIPAPTGGWDAQSSLAAMKPDRAVLLDNWIPRNGYVEMRRGFVLQAGGAPGPVQSLLIYRAGGTDRLFAAAGGAIYEGSTAGSPLASAYTGLTSVRLQYANFSNDAGTWLVACNGADTPIKFDGTTWSTTAIASATGATITLDPTKLSDVMLHKRRLHFIERGTRRIWYLGLNAISGTAGLLDLGPVFSKGGSLVCMGTWTISSSFGPDDYAVYMTDQGQVAIYKGTDPSDATAWALVGVFDLGKPLGPRALVRYGSDLVVVTTDGAIPLSQALTIDRAQENAVAITAKIQNAWADAQGAAFGMFGWDGVIYPEGQLAVFNIPVAELASSVQFVMNTQTGAWGRLVGMNGFCWAVANGGLYFGAMDGVYQADRGSSDNGGAITADVKPAFNAYGAPGRLKRFTMLRPLLKCSPLVQPALEMVADYRESIPSATPTVIDAGSVNPDDADEIRYDWTSANALGYVAAPRMRVVLQGDGSGYLIDVGDGSTLGDGVGDDVIERDPLPFDVPVQLIGFDVQFQAGGVL